MVKSEDTNLSSCFNYFASTDITAKTEHNISFKANWQNNEFCKAIISVSKKQRLIMELGGGKLLCWFWLGGVVYMCVSTFMFLKNQTLHFFLWISGLSVCIRWCSQALWKLANDTHNYFYIICIWIPFCSVFHSINNLPLQ